MPVHSKSRNCETPKPNAEEFAYFLGDIFASDTGFSSGELKVLLEETSANGVPDVEPFTIFELQLVLKEMRGNKCADTSGLVAECFIYGNLDLHKCLLDVFNSMLAVGRFDASWSHIVFAMLPKGGTLLSPSCQFNCCPQNYIQNVCQIIFFVLFFFSSHLFSRVGSGWSCFTGQLPGMCHLYTGGGGLGRGWRLGGGWLRPAPHW